MKYSDLLSEERIKEIDLSTRDFFIGKCLIGIVSNRHIPFSEVKSVKAIKVIRYEITETDYVAIGDDISNKISIPLTQLDSLRICGWSIFFKGEDRYIVISWDCISSLMEEIMHSLD